MLALGENVTTLVSIAVTGAVSAGALALTRRKDRDEAADRHEDNDLSKFGVIGNLGAQIAEQIIAAREAEAASCAEKIAALQARLDEHSEKIAECELHRLHDAEVIASLAAKAGVDLHDT